MASYDQWVNARIHEWCETLYHAAVDERSKPWSHSFTDFWPREIHNGASNAEARRRCLPRRGPIARMYDNPTRHRGAVSTMLSQSGLDVGVTETALMARFASDAASP